MPPLRPHHKSRNGCDRCRERRVKCDEKGPPCSNCTSRQLNCTYLKVAAARSQTAKPRPSKYQTARSSDSSARSQNSVSSPVSNCSLSTQQEIDNLELMHQFSTDTYKSLCVSDSENATWQTTIPRLALKYHYLLDGIMALASMHLATFAEPAEALIYQERGLQYYNRSLSPFRHAIDNITPENCDAVFAHSIVMIAISIASPRLTATKDESSCITANIVVLFELLQGVKKILAVTKPWVKIELFTQGEFWKKTTTELNADEDAALAHVASLNDLVMTGVYSKQHDIYKNVLSHLRHCYAKFARSPDPAPVMAWLAAVDKDFVDSVRCRQHFSLLILMYWGVLLGKLEGKRWWANNAGKALVSELLEALQDGDSRWEKALSWVQSQMPL
ncbi:C6 transcription factor [Penicillium odoratum]|uniref:C6 transcription factor n=1 Tax=Penicillium odoratum TaxID=1167516 RepID=UPI002546AE89|nr:C6 transcription factor [Penicillium odoratum]KAJ5772361.1 C6 transcription factor [Penicillium odoratum]